MLDQSLGKSAIEDVEDNHNAKRSLSEAERRQILYEWNDTHVEFPALCAHRLFEQQVERDPEAIAVVVNEQRLSYGELNQRANQIAHYLRKLGVGPDRLVGVCLQRSPEMVAGLLGVWKAGGAYVPLDPSYPQERLAFMVADAAVQVLLTDTRCEHLFSPAHANTVCLDSDWPAIAQESQSNPDSESTPSNLAYVMYTSGSTGTPKGAMILQSGLVNYLTWAIKTYGVKPGGSVPVHSSISFDLTVTSLYTPLLAGGRVELLAEDAAAQSLLTALKRQKGRSLVKITPAHLELLSQQLAPNEAADMTNVFVIGGENLLAEKLKLWRESAPATRLINEYGPTETVVGCCVYEVQANDPGTGSVPIGRPIDNTQLYVLDSDLRPVPVGETGELYIGGVGVARGYWNRPELTEERFLPDPFSGTPGARLYKSGDLARYRQDGILEYLGRVDNQVKVRGYRIELGEIESALASHPAVQSCAVLAREDEPGDRQLVGYVSPVKNQSVASEQLRAFLEQRLPSYMVPAHFVILDALPLTPNGKVDRKALPAPSLQSVAVTASVAAPRNGTEKALAAIWSELLKVDNVGVDDDFFDLGGHSLMAFKAMSRIRDVFAVDLPVQDLFENPTIAGIAKLLTDTENSTGTIERIERRDGEQNFPLSASQEQLWFLYQLAPGSPAYNVVDLVRLDGIYNPQALGRALAELIRRHETLRTSLSNVNGQPMQVVLPTAELKPSEFDLSALTETDRKSEWSRIVHEQSRKPFDLSQAPLLRMTIIHKSASEHDLLVVIHHIIADEWSMGLIHKEIAQFYKDFSRGQFSSLAELPIQYADFTCWQRNRLQGEVLEKQLAYWKNELAGAQTVLELASDKPRPAIQSFQGATQFFHVPLNVLESIKLLGRQEQATLFMTLLAGFMALLHRYTGQDDVLVGTPVSLRTLGETENLIGYFLNTVVLRAQFKEDLNFRSLLQQIRERALGAYAHADMPFNQLVTALTTERDFGRSPLFQVMFVLHDPDGIAEVSRVSGRDQLETGTSKFDLTLDISETKNGLDVLIEYSTDLFEPLTIQRIAKHYGTLLASIGASPDQRISRLAVLSSAERSQVLYDWNETSADYPRGVSLSELVETQVKRTPGAVAVVYGENRLTYSELSERANRLAHELRKHGAGPDQLVGLFVERSTDLVVSLLAIVKSGAAYLPLDPLFPSERLDYMLEDSGARLLITQQSLRGDLPRFAGTIIQLEDQEWQSNPVDTPAISVGPEDLAYVIYTSGSTGKPKGVQVPRGALTNLLWSMRTWLQLREHDRLLAVTTISFDIAAADVWLPLLVGAQTVVSSRESAADGNQLRALLERHNITFLQATPVTWRLLFGAGWTGKPDLQAVCTGEAMPPEVAEQLAPAVKRLWNLYGPTETTIWSTGYQVTDGTQPILIGRPVANTQCYLLDQQREPVPVGVIGELYIGGDGLARGYLNRPELTAEKFVTDPFRGGAARMYRTGDLARYLPDGNIECLGRIDHQVKIRGYRIELGEIEAVLLAEPEIKQAVVIVREDSPGDKRLVAYYTATGSGESKVEAINTEQLRAHLSACLPEYMIPAAYVHLDAMPLTPNGKLDRKALPAPEANSFLAREYEPPQGETESKTAAIWADILKLQRIGRHDNFFDLGGHSLMAAHTIALLNSEFGTKLPVRVLLLASTISELASIIDKQRATELEDWPSLIPIQPKGNSIPLFCVARPNVNALGYLMLSRELGSNQPVYGLQVQLEEDPVLDFSGEQYRTTAAEYIRAMKTVQPQGPYILIGQCQGAFIAFEMVQQLERSGEKVAFLGILDAWTEENTRNKLLFRIDLALKSLKSLRKRHLQENFERVRSRLWHRKASNYSAISRHADANHKEETYFERYFPGKDFRPPICSSPITVFRTSKQFWYRKNDDTLGWKNRSLVEVKVRNIPGDHMTFTRQPHVKELARIIAKLLQEAVPGNLSSLKM